MTAKLTPCQEQFIINHGGRAQSFPHRGFLIDLIEQRARENPDDPALVHDCNALSYGQLNAKANELAIELRQAGVRQGLFTPLLMQGDLNLALAIVALMKLGAPFVILDSKWPMARIRQLLQDISSKVVLIENALDIDLPSESAKAIEINHQRLQGADHIWFPRDTCGSDPLYGFFTSGSTGKPKCCINTQKGLLNRFDNMSVHFNLNKADSVLMNSNHTFDSALWQLLWPLTTGARVILPTPEQRADIHKTLGLIATYRVAMTDFVPSTFRLLVNLLDSQSELIAELASLSFLLIGGEKINAGCVEKYQRRLPDTELINTYGPTEAAIGMIFHHIPPGSEDIPLGTPIFNTYAIILDSDSNPCKPGDVGEIVIGGDCLGAGYLNQPIDETDSYIENPYSWIPGDKLYRTGDLGYLRDDGTFQYVSRMNDTLKVNGVLVCLPEIEDSIKSLPQIDAACVVVKRSRQAARLHAFAIPAPSQRSDSLPATILQHLRERLPKSSLPRVINLVDNFPLLANGKIDRKRLAEVGSPPPMSGVDEPRGPAARLQRIFSELLDGAPLAIDGNLFDAGLDSLTAQFARIKIREQLSCDLDLAVIHERPTIAQLTRYIEGQPDDRQKIIDDFIKQDLRLADNLDFSAHRPQPQAGRQMILLTGATGFVGIHLLNSLLQQSDRRVATLVRAADDKHALARLKKAARRFSLYQDIDFSRVEVIAADIAKHNFGLNDHRIAGLFSQVSDIVLNATNVNFLLCYQTLRKTNTLPVYNTLELVEQFPSKNIYYISSLAVLNQHKTNRQYVHENHQVRCPTGGYAQSKWVAENLLLKARVRGLNVAIIRLGEIMPSTQQGIPNGRAFFSALVDICMALGVAPFSKAKICYTPVDYMASYCSNLVLSKNQGKFCNIHGYRDHTLSFYEVILHLARLSGCRMSFVDIATFRDYLDNAPETLKHQVAQLTAVTHQLDSADPLNDYFEDYTRCYEQSNFRKWSEDEFPSRDHDDGIFKAYSQYLLPISSSRGPYIERRREIL